ncbi:uncharacterized protein N7515_008721 [Penicillium bovifimosum]|uniref:Uncharacterized protein n=1 Tax=Penicillium bovifimosum TaxID=126998 RepID=A0A9W9GNG6_9EURO|nr:uncharacterized protein N7515_008721 [Penicillium bovifimosum]KAJ5124896.1 hypothetical protein N7515_008721 [Penicillium bovifimosum]
MNSVDDILTFFITRSSYCRSLRSCAICRFEASSIKGQRITRIDTHSKPYAQPIKSPMRNEIRDHPSHFRCNLEAESTETRGSGCPVRTASLSTEWSPFAPEDKDQIRWSVDNALVLKLDRDICKIRGTLRSEKKSLPQADK